METKEGKKVMHDIFYFTDVHGMYSLFKSAMDYCNKCDPEAMIIFGGDACDRGPDGYKIMKELIANPKVVYIRGNHEDMFLRAAHDMICQYPEIANTVHNQIEANDIIGMNRWMDSVNLSIYNGGRPTLTDWLMDGAKTEFLYELAYKMVYTFQIENHVCFSHAGGNQRIWRRVNDSEYNHEIPDKGDAHAMIWDRYYLDSMWDANHTIIFGHTPTCYLNDYVSVERLKEADIHPVKYYEESGAHIAMDTGAVFTGRLFVLNCLTMKAQGFEDIDAGTQCEPQNHTVKEIEVIQL